MDEQLDQYIRQRANRACEYRLMPGRYYRTPLVIDHIIARQHAGKTTRGNLALACLHCNSHKGPNVAGMDPRTGRMTRLFHPRRHRWSYHFRWDGPWLVGRTAIGRTTIAVLAINHPDAVEVREALIDEGVYHPE